MTSTLPRLFCLGLATLLPLLSSPLSAQEKPNIIFILCDDLGWGDLGVLFQNERDAKRKHATPNLDSFAAEGIQLRRHYCPAPVCAPSRASLLTGFHQGHADIRNNQFDKALGEDYTLPGVLKTAGYSTALIGKYGLQGEGTTAQTWPAYPTKRGFDEFLGYVSHYAGHLHYPAHTWPIGNSEGHRGKMELWHNEEEISASLTKCFTSDLFTAYAKQWITEQTNDRSAKPFFLYLAYDTPHAALQLPPCEYPAGGGLKGGVQWLGDPGKMINTAKGEVDAWIHPDHEGWTDLEQRQAGMIRRIDQHIGDLKQLLIDLEIDDNTLVVFSSDNGPHEESYIAEVNYEASLFQAYGPFDGIKRDTFEGGIRVPTLARWPKHIAAGQIDNTPAQFHDWMNTFLDAAGAPQVAQSDGVSLLPTLTGEGEQVTPTTYIEYQNGQRTPDYPDFAEARRKEKRGEMQVLFLDGYKGLRYRIESADQPFEIYDVEADPSERNNLADSSPEFVALQKKMLAEVTRLRRPNGEAKRPYDDAPMAAIANRETAPGLAITYQPGEFEWVPAALTTEPTLLEEGTAVPGAGMIEASGYLRVGQSGEYTFSIDAPGATILHVHQALVVDGDSPQAKSIGKLQATARLKKGLHPIRLRYLTAGNAANLEVTGPGKTQLLR